MRTLAFCSSLLLLLAAVRPARACSVCGCDPAAGTLGVDRPSVRALRVGLEDRYLTKESGAGADAESERENRLLLRGQYAPLERLVFQLELPFYAWKRHLDAAGVQDDNAHGLGDLAVAARYELLRVGFEARHVLALTGSLKAPTGANGRRLPGQAPDEHLQLGSGSWDPQAGFTYLYGLRPWTLYANATARLNGTNARGFRYGHALFGTLGGRRAFGAEGRLIGSLEAQVRSAGKDVRGDGTRDDDSGGQVYYAAGSVAYALTNDLLLRALLQVPTVTALHGVQSEHPVGYVQLTYDFAL
ncbi:MAG: hypothetical protein NVSMB23_28830 [Myxococcales bacterium]